MKRKFLLTLAAIAALFVGAGNASADGTDVTASYIGDLTKIVGGSGSCSAAHKLSDAAYPNGNAWYNTQAITSGTWHAFVKTADSPYEMESWTADCFGEGVVFGHRMVLPAGNYTLTFKAEGCIASNASATCKASAASGVYAFCTGQTDVDVTNTTEADATYHDVSFTFDVTTANTSYDFGVKLANGGNADWFKIGSVTLTLNSTDIYPVSNASKDAWTQTFDSEDSKVGALECNTWSVEGNKDNTDFLAPFNQIWVASGSKLSDQTVSASYTPTQSGVYKVSGQIRAMNESGGTVTGAKIYVGDVEADACGGTAITNGTLGTYTAMADGTSGTAINFGLKIKDATINWISFKNFTITYVGSGLPDADITALTATVPTGKMNATIQSTLNGYVTDLTTNKSVSAYNTLAAYIPTAQTSVNIYTSIAAINTKAATLDAAGVASYASTLTAYNEGTLTTVAEAQTAYETAVKAQTTPGTSMTVAVETDGSKWTLKNALASGEYGPRYNTWSGTANGMSSANYYEYWIAKESGPLQDNSISTTVTGLHKGYYVANLEIAANDEKNSATCTGVTFTAGGATNDLSTYNATSSFNGHVGTYGVMFQVTADNTDVEIALNTASTTCNWLTFRNPTLTYLGENVGLDGGDYTVKAQDNTYVNRGGDSSQEAILSATGLVITAATTDGVTKFTFADGTANENYLFGSTSTIYTNGTDKEKKGSTTYAVTTADAGKYIFNIQKGKYFAAGTGAESNVAAVVYSDSPYAWTLEAVTYATSADYAALTSAISDAEAKILGFAAGEYAPYNNVAALTALATAKAIDSSAKNEQETVQAATTALTNATWTANTEEVNAVYDGSFNLTTATSGGYTVPTGWTNLGYNTRVYNSSNEGTNVGIKGTSKEACMFAKFTTEYGTVSGYTMPLKKGLYSLSFIYGGWNEVGTRDIKVYNAENNAEVLPVTVTAKDNTAHTNADSWSTYNGSFYVPADGDYILSFYRANTSSQNQIAVSDIVIKTMAEPSDVERTTAKDMYGTICVPYVPEVSNATLYSAAISGAYVTLTEVTNPVAGTPYIYQATAANPTFAYTSGAVATAPVAALPLVGVFKATDVPVGCYVLQTKGDTQMFYVVTAEAGQPNLSANKAYLTTATEAKALLINRPGEETAISALNALTTGNAKIYDINGRERKALQKGINIVNGVKVYVK